MKNKKNLTITMIMIAMFLTAIAAGAKIFTGYITTGSETENELTADIKTPDSFEEPFNYPYFKETELEYNTDCAGYTVYKEQLDANKKLMKLFGGYIYMNSPENTISYQQISNICGEALKYLYGITYHTVSPAMISCIDYNGKGAYYWYSVLDAEKAENNTDMQNMVINIKADMYTGKITTLEKSPFYYINLKPNPEIDCTRNMVFTDDLKEKVLSQLASDLAILGFPTDIKTDKCNLICNEGFVAYDIYFSLSDNTNMYAVYNSSDNELFELCTVTVRD